MLWLLLQGNSDFKSQLKEYIYCIIDYSQVVHWSEFPSVEHQDDVKGEEDMAAKKAALLQKRLRREKEAQERKQQQEQDQEQKKEAARYLSLLMYMRLNGTTKLNLQNVEFLSCHT